ncbi:MAG TPA: SUKH-3 domain-containing protein [Sphingomicrobium sp.]|nr:SUKH-3 domain-containing protein [Sphingomicrobium sp.]
MSVVPEAMRTPFRGAGWFEGRQVAVDRAVPAGHPASAVLAELGGLVLVEPAPNICSIAFQHVAEGAPFVAEWEAALGTKMVGIAKEDDGHSELHLTQSGQVIGCSLVHPACFLVGTTFEGAMNAIGRGERASPMLLPAQDEVTLYGVTFRHGDEAVIGPAELA